MRKSYLARKNERIIRREEEDELSERLDGELCAAINKTATKFRKRLPANRIDRLIVKALTDQLYYAVNEERRF